MNSIRKRKSFPLLINSAHQRINQQAWAKVLKCKVLVVYACINNVVNPHYRYTERFLFKSQATSLHRLIG